MDEWDDEDANGIPVHRAIEMIVDALGLTVEVEDVAQGVVTLRFFRAPEDQAP